MRHADRLLAKCCLVAVTGLNVAFCSDDPSSKPEPGLRHGYVHCGTEKKQTSVSVYAHPCNPKPAAELSCGEAVDVVSREGAWLKIRSGDNTNRYISYYSVSATKNYYLPIGLWTAEGKYEPNCKDVIARMPTHSPVALYNPDPEYTEEARRAKVAGTVELSLTVGADGLAHDVTVIKALGYGLDEQAVHSVQEWRFEPAAENGKPVPARITIEVSFRTYQ
jgi:TonB family protein